MLLVKYELGHRPELYAYTGRAAYDAAKTGHPIKPSSLITGEKSLANSASHWGSVYQHSIEVSTNLKTSQS